MTNTDLIISAFDAMQRAYAPYSAYKVGAALLTATGKIYTGCNIENAAFGPTVCAERVAFFKAISQGEKHFTAIAVAGGKCGVPTDYFYPCGVCRQVMAEFCGSDFTVLTAKSETDYKSHTLGELLPFGFSPDKLKE